MKLFGAIRQKWTHPHNGDAPHTENAIADIARETATMPADSEPPDRIAQLTPRERDLFLLLLEGYTLKESARQMSVKYSTANTHMTAIYKKLNVNSRAELIIRYRAAVKKD